MVSVHQGSPTSLCVDRENGAFERRDGHEAALLSEGQEGERVGSEVKGKGGRQKLRARYLIENPTRSDDHQNDVPVPSAMLYETRPEYYTQIGRACTLVKYEMDPA